MHSTIMKFLIIVLMLFPILAIGENAKSSTQTSALFVDLTHPKILYAENQQQRLIPASVTKLFVTAAALKQFGNTYVFTTPVFARGHFNNGILDGDLIFYGVGDPSLTNEKLLTLVTSLRSLGLTQVNGNIIVNNSYFGTVEATDPDRLKAKSTSTESYDGLLSSAASNFGTIAVTIFPGSKEGDPAKISLFPNQISNAVLSGNVTTSSQANTPISLTRESEHADELLHITGTIPLHASPITLYRSVGNPDQATGNLLTTFLQQAGIKVTGKVVIESTQPQEQDQLLTTIQSQTLAQILWEMLWNSNNFIADMLTLDLWQQNQQTIVSKSTSLKEAANNLLAPYQEMLKHSAFSAHMKTLPTLNSGSGLTPTNQLSAQDIVILLDGMYQDQRNFPVFYGALVPMESMAEKRPQMKITVSEHPWINRVSIKTGSLTQPKLVFSLAGYFRMKNGDLGAFAILLNKPNPNGDKKQLAETRVELLKKVDEFFATH